MEGGSTGVTYTRSSSSSQQVLWFKQQRARQIDYQTVGLCIMIDESFLCGISMDCREYTWATFLPIAWRNRMWFELIRLPQLSYSGRPLAYRSPALKQTESIGFKKKYRMSGSTRVSAKIPSQLESCGRWDNITICDVMCSYDGPCSKNPPPATLHNCF